MHPRTQKPLTATKCRAEQWRTPPFRRRVAPPSVFRIFRSSPDPGACPHGGAEACAGGESGLGPEPARPGADPTNGPGASISATRLRAGVCQDCSQVRSGVCHRSWPVGRAALPSSALPAGPLLPPPPCHPDSYSHIRPVSRAASVSSALPAGLSSALSAGPLRSSPSCRQGR